MGDAAEVSQVYHVVNPHTTSWETNFAKNVIASYPRCVSMRPVSFQEWVRVLSDYADKVGSNEMVDVDRNPAIRLVDFFVDVAKSDKPARVFVSDNAVRASNTLRDIDVVNCGWINGWMTQWGLKVENC
ncbi:hypothetical protein F4677DRAFT_342861 [Hypoxylon crocopeplum]|nr:hypothetical protein F4677DRAFT_342861 [Hypoxylon crocopeplum]